MQRTRGFTLVELLVALFALALLAGMSWRGLDGMMRARTQTEARADEILTLQTGLAQWDADLDAIVELPQVTAMEWNGRVLRLTRRSTVAAGEGVHVVAWTRREGQWLRWQSLPLATRGEIAAAWQQADYWSQNPGDALRRLEVAITPLDDWQLFYFRGNSWTNPLSSATGEQAGSSEPPPAQEVGAPAPGSRSAGVLPEGVRLILQLPAGRALGGQVTLDWVRGTSS